MTALKAVADDVLGNIARKVWDLIRRIMEGSADPKRVLAILQWAQNGVPKPHNEGSSWGTYLLESSWAYDNSHREFATINLEKCDSDVPFEDILNSSVPDGTRLTLYRMLERIYEAQSPSHGSRKMVRLYRVLGVNHFGILPGINDEGVVFRTGAVDMHLVLLPICEFTSDSVPVPCIIGT